MSILIIGKAESGLVEALAQVLFTTGEAAEYLGVDRRTIWEETQRGRLHPLQPRKTKFYVQTELNAYRIWRSRKKHKG